jgi:hypothetical protein
MGYGFGYNGDLNEQNFQRYNLTKDDLKEIKKDWRKDKKLTRKVKKIIKKMQDSGKGVFHLGSQTKFAINNNKCEKIESSNRSYSEEQKAIISNKVHSKSACAEVAKIYKKHKNEIQKCEIAHQAISKDLYADGSKVKDIQPYSIGLGGFPGYGGYGGYGAYGGSSNPISGHLGTCQVNYPSLFDQEEVTSGLGVGPGLDSFGMGIGF